MLRLLLLALLVAGLAACATPRTPEVVEVTQPPVTATATRVSTTTPAATATRQVAVAALATPTPSMAGPTASAPATATVPPALPTLTATATVPPTLPTATATVTPTAEPFAAYFISALAEARYGEGMIQVGPRLEEATAFRRYAFTYPSDGLTITGYMNVPVGAGPFPIIVLNHGYYAPERYRQGNGTRAAADFLAQRGYLTLASDYRNYGQSERGPNFFRFGYVLDVVNLVALLETLPEGWGDVQRVGMWGHSMGGGIAINAAVLAGERVDAVVVYGGMSGDMADNSRHVRAMGWHREEFAIPTGQWGGPDDHPEAYQQMSALHFMDRARAAFSIHHGTHDEQVPYPWSEKLRDAVASANLPVEHYSYPGAPHSLQGAEWALFMERVTVFFDRELGR